MLDVCVHVIVWSSNVMHMATIHLRVLTLAKPVHRHTAVTVNHKNGTYKFIITVNHSTGIHHCAHCIALNFR